MAIKPDPKRTHVRARKIPRPEPVADDEIGGLTAGACWAEPDGRLGFACPGCARPGAVRVGDPKPADGPSWHVLAGSVGEPEKLTLEPSINCQSCCGWHGYLTCGVFRSC